MARLVSLLLIIILAALHVQLWNGRGSVPSVAGMREQLAAQQRQNQQAQQANERLEAEVNDLKEGLEMVEDKARSELGMVKPDEVLVQITRSPAPTSAPAPAMSR